MFYLFGKYIGKYISKIICLHAVKAKPVFIHHICIIEVSLFPCAHTHLIIMYGLTPSVIHKTRAIPLYIYRSWINCKALCQQSFKLKPFFFLFLVYATHQKTDVCLRVEFQFAACNDYYTPFFLVANVLCVVVAH